MTKWTDRVNEIRQMVIEGKTADEMAEYYGCSVKLLRLAVWRYTEGFRQMRKDNA